MSQSSQPDPSGGLAKLPIDILLDVFDCCDLTDVLNLALTCKELRTATEERHVWFTQFKRRCTAFRQAPFRSRTKELHLHSTAQLKSWTIEQARTDALWLRNGITNKLNFQTIRINEPEDGQYLTVLLLPGGEYLVAPTTNKDILLKKIERGDDVGDLEWVLADVARRSPPSPEASWFSDELFTDTTCEYPLIAYHTWRDTSITIFRLDYDSRAFSVQKKIQADPHGKVRGYHLRYLGIRGDTIMWFYSDDDSRLQERLVVAKLSDPGGSATGYLDVDWGLTLVASKFEVLTANTFIRFNHGGIHLYRIPHLPSGIQLQGGNDDLPTPSLAWTCGYGGPNMYGGLYYDRTDAILSNLYLHNDNYSSIIEFGVPTPGDTEPDTCAGHPVILNHIITSYDRSPCRPILSQRSKGRKGAHLDGDDDGFHLFTVLVDDPDRFGWFRLVLSQHELPDIDKEWVKKMEYDEVTGRILLLTADEYSDTCRLCFVDLSRP